MILDYADIRSASTNCQTTLSVHTCVRQFENEHNTHVYNLGPIYCCEYYKTQESRAIAGRTARFAVNVDTYRIFHARCTSAQRGIEIACRPSVRLSLSVPL